MEPAKTRSKFCLPETILHKWRVRCRSTGNVVELFSSKSIPDVLVHRPACLERFQQFTCAFHEGLIVDGVSCKCFECLRTLYNITHQDLTCRHVIHLSRFEKCKVDSSCSNFRRQVLQQSVVQHTGFTQIL